MHVLTNLSHSWERNERLRQEVSTLRQDFSAFIISDLMMLLFVFVSNIIIFCVKRKAKIGNGKFFRQHKTVSVSKYERFFGHAMLQSSGLESLITFLGY